MTDITLRVLAPAVQAAESVDLIAHEAAQAVLVPATDGRLVILSLRTLLGLVALDPDRVGQAPVGQLASLVGQVMPERAGVAAAAQQFAVKSELLARWTGPPIAAYLRCPKIGSHTYPDDGSRTTCFICDEVLETVLV